VFAFLALATDDTTTTEGTDYTTKDGDTVTIAGYATESIMVTIADDTDAEQSETFDVSFTGAPGTTTSSTVTITDNDGKRLCHL